MAIAIVTCLMIGFISGLSTQEALDTWYAQLEKPFYHPPDSIFAPVWVVLYVMMGISAALVWHAGWERKDVQQAIMLFLAQLMFNAIWPVFFFGTRSPRTALVLIVILVVLLGLCIWRFKPINRWAALLLIPYFLWVLFAGVLNASMVYLNPPAIPS